MHSLGITVRKMGFKFPLFALEHCVSLAGQHGLRVPEISRKSNCKVDSNQNSSSVGGDGQIVGITGAEHDTLAKVTQYLLFVFSTLDHTSLLSSSKLIIEHMYA